MMFSPSVSVSTWLLTKHGSQLKHGEKMFQAIAAATDQHPNMTGVKRMAWAVQGARSQENP
jgi:sirohydrochlorin ferrochelatase